MKDLLTELDNWTSQSKPMILARVIHTWGSSPRPVGSCMLFTDEMEMAGSVSGGCVETTVIKESLSLLKSGKGKSLSFGVSNEEAWSVGLTCGGELDVWVNDISQDEIWKELSEQIHQDQNVAMVTRLVEGENHHTLIKLNGEASGSDLPQEIQQQAVFRLRERKSQVEEHEGTRYFVNVFPSRSRMIIIGAAHITRHLVELGKMYDFGTTVIDPRGIFAEKTQFSTSPDQIIDQYPSEVLVDMGLDPNTYAVILSHDPKIDDDALHILLRSEVAYIGALGSRKNHAKRTERLLSAGFTQEEIERIDAPIGMDIQAKGAQEIALSIMGAIIQAKNQYL